MSRNVSNSSAPCAAIDRLSKRNFAQRGVETPITWNLQNLYGRIINFIRYFHENSSDKRTENYNKDMPSQIMIFSVK